MREERITFFATSFSLILLIAKIPAVIIINEIYEIKKVSLNFEETTLSRITESPSKNESPREILRDFLSSVQSFSIFVVIKTAETKETAKHHRFVR